MITLIMAITNVIAHIFAFIVYMLPAVIIGGIIGLVILLLMNGGKKK